MTGLLFRANFLTIAVSPEILSREQTLLTQLQTAEPADSFAIVDDLQTLYTRHLRTGGLQGRHWLEEHRQNTIQRIEEENLYADFIRFRESGTSLRMPGGVRLPLGLRFSEELGRPSVIEIESPLSPFAHKSSYFLLDDLYFERETITPADLARAREQFRSGDLKENVQITRHHRTGRHMVKSNAALCKILWENGHSYVLGWTDNTGFFTAPYWRVSDLRVEEPRPLQRAMLAPIPPAPFSLGFTPRRDLSFAPRAVTLLRQGAPYPVIMEQMNGSDLLSLAPLSLRNKLEERLYKERSSAPLLLAVRSPTGALEGYALNYFAPDRRSLRCQHAQKIDEERETGIRYFGLALTIARLMYMRDEGYWPEEGPLLTNIYAGISDSYKTLLGIPLGDCRVLENSVDDISQDDGRLFLERNPFHFEKID